MEAAKYNVILCHDVNQDFKEQEIQEFYMCIGLINLY